MTSPPDASAASAGPRLVALVAVVALGGAIGGTARHAVDLVLPFTDGFPWGTFLINVVGAALLALLPAVGAVARHPLGPAFVGTGVLGGFTTLSALSEQARSLADGGRAGLAATYVAGSVAAGLLAVLLVRRLTSPEQRRVFRAEEGDE